MVYVEERVVLRKRYFVDEKDVDRYILNPDLLETVSQELVSKERTFLRSDHILTSIRKLPPENLSLDQVLLVVAEYYSTSLNDLFSPSRKQEIVQTRAVYYYIGKQIGFDENDIAKQLNVNRSTVNHHYHKLRSYLTMEPNLRHDIKSIFKTLNEIDGTVNY